MPNIELTPKAQFSAFRKMAIGTWETTYDPSVYGTMVIEMDKAMKYIEAFRAATGKRITVSHMMAKAAGAALERMPDANAILRFNRPYLRSRIGIFFQVAMEEASGEIDLSGATIFDPEKKSLETIVDEFQAEVDKVRGRRDKNIEKSKGMFKAMPFFLLNFVLKAISFFSYTLNLNLERFGIPKDPFGSMMITNVGSLGLDVAYVPLVPYSRVPLLLALGAVQEAPMVENGQVVVKRIMRVNATFDHRLLDGTHAAIMSKVVRTWLENPVDHFGPIPERA